MASPNSDYTELVTTTLANRRRSIADNVMNHNALLARFRQQGRQDLASGGRTLVEELRYRANSTFGWYDGYELLDITPQSTHSAAEYSWKQASTSVTISGGELAMNSGRERMIPLLQARTEGAENDMMDGISTAIYSDGTGSGGKEIGGLQLLIADDPSTGTVGGIDRASFSFWRNYEATAAGSTFASSTVQSDMQTAWLNLIRGSDKPDIIVGDSNAFSAFWESLTEIQRLNSPDQGVAGFRSLAFNGPGGQAPVIFDDQCPTDHMYFLNTKFLKFRPHRDRNFITTDQRTSINQDAVVVLLLWMGNLTMSNASLQGVIHT